jgi:hypothetical protein
VIIRSLSGAVSLLRLGLAGAALVSCSVSLGAGALADPGATPPALPPAVPAVVDAIGTVSQAPGTRLDRAHDWLYQRLDTLFKSFDKRFARSDAEPMLVPVSPLRIGLDSIVLHKEDGLSAQFKPDIEVTLRLPNLERRLRLFVSSDDVPESPAARTLDRQPVNVGLRFMSRSHLSFDLGVRARLQPAAFAALKWAPTFQLGTTYAYPLMKIYVESDLGPGASAGLALQRQHDSWLARSASYAEWRRRTSAIYWNQSFLFGYARALIQDGRYTRLSTGHDLACGAVALLSVSGDRSSRAVLYEAGVLVKRPLRDGWLFGYLEPMVRWDRNGDWHPEAGIRLGFDALFWGLASAPDPIAPRCH